MNDIVNPSYKEILTKYETMLCEVVLPVAPYSSIIGARLLDVEKKKLVNIFIAEEVIKQLDEHLKIYEDKTSFEIPLHVFAQFYDHALKKAEIYSYKVILMGGTATRDMIVDVLVSYGFKVEIDFPRCAKVSKIST